MGGIPLERDTNDLDVFKHTGPSYERKQCPEKDRKKLIRWDVPLTREENYSIQENYFKV